jgi:hypothetical protein
MPAIVESPTNETGGASIGGLAAPTYWPGAPTVTVATSTAATTPNRNAHGRRVARAFAIGWIAGGGGESDIVALVPKSAAIRTDLAKSIVGRSCVDIEICFLPAMR